MGRAGKPVIIILVSVLVLITFFSYRQSLENGFTNWDDPAYVTSNHSIRELTPGSVLNFFRHPAVSNWHPLTMVSLSIDWQLSKQDNNAANESLQMDARVFHATSLIFHLLNVVLVFFFIWLLSGKRVIASFVTALLFAVYPMHAESVAWVSERKDVLYTFFFLAALICYVIYTRRPEWKYFAFAGGLFILSLLSKPAAVVFPLVLFAVDYFAGRKFTVRSVLEKSPLLLLSIMAGVVTLMIQTKESLTLHTEFTSLDRLFIASYNLLIYPFKLLIPAGLSPFYPYPALTNSGILPLIYYLSPLIVIVIAVLVIRAAKYSRVIPFGFLFYFLCIILVLQVIPVGNAMYSDRYSYIPSIGLFFIAGFYADELFMKKKRSLQNIKYAVILVSVIYTGILIKQLTGRIEVWKDTETLWTDVIQKYPETDPAYMNRGNYYAGINKLDLALKDYSVLIQHRSNDPKVYSNTGNIYVMMGENGKAMDAYSRGLAIDSTAYTIYLNRGLTQVREKRYDDAVRDFATAERLNPGATDVLNVLAYSYADMNLPEKAVDYFTRLIRKDSLNDDYFLKRGQCYYKMNKPDEAFKDWRKCLGVNPGNGYAYLYISEIYIGKKDTTNASLYLQKARLMGVNAGQNK